MTLHSISIKLNSVPVTPQRPRLQDSPTMLTQELLDAKWKEMTATMEVSHPDVAELLKDRNVVVKEHGLFAIVVDNGYFEKQIVPHRVMIIEEMRRLTQMPMLNFKVSVNVAQKEAIAYAPKDKYETMLKRNPVLQSFRNLFEEIDF